jgi:hypothetical protein
MTSQREISGWAIGWTAFAAIMMMIIGFFQAFAGLVGILKDTFYIVAPEYLLKLDATTWGWIHLIWGVLVIVAGFALFSGAVWARTIGVLMAVLSMFTMFAWLPWYPVWAIIIITANVFVIWALTVHGRDITADI